MKNTILDISRQNKMRPLSPWFESQLNKYVSDGTFLSPFQLEIMGDNIVYQLAQRDLRTIIIGISGGVDSALTAALFKRAGYKVYGVLMPIHQNPEETARGEEVIADLGLERIHKDLTKAYESVLNDFVDVDPTLVSGDDKDTRIRRGNLRARTRMMNLYNLARLLGGAVASTDNFSELSAGFWTLHGDVGDIAPIQSLYKSWEVPMLSKLTNVPESVWRANPTDGLGVDAGDEAQFGCSYLEWDLMLMAMLQNDLSFTDERSLLVHNIVSSRMLATRFKRLNPENLITTVAPTRFSDLESLEKNMVKD